jgi:hypothetical protein
MKKVGSKSQVFKGTAEQTIGGVTKSGIVRKKNEDGSYRYVFKSKSNASKKCNPWISALADARDELQIEGFVIIKKTGRTDGAKLYKRAKELMDEYDYYC